MTRSFDFAAGADAGNAMARVVMILGTQQRVAEAVGRTQPTVSVYVRSGRPPAAWCLVLEHATGGRVTCHDLRPDLFPAPAGGGDGTSKAQTRGAANGKEEKTFPRKVKREDAA